MKPVTMEDLVGTRVLIHLHREAFEFLDVQGIDDPQFVARVLGFDSFGLWVENPRFCITPIYTDDGAYIPPEQRAEVCYRAIVLLQWAYIETILQFPDRPTFGTSLNASEIGFKLTTKLAPAQPASGKRPAGAAAAPGKPAASVKPGKSKGAKRG